MKQRKTRRTALIKGYLTDAEKDAFRRACTAIGKSCSDVLHDLCLSKIRSNGKPGYPGNDRPKLAELRTQHFPPRHVSYGAVPLIRYRV